MSAVATVLPNSTAIPYYMDMHDHDVPRFRRAYWQAVYALDAVRLQAWERSSLTLPQLRVLFQVRRCPGITIGELSRKLGITVSTASGLASKLVARNLLLRTTTPDDRRQAPLHLTQDGEALAGAFSAEGRVYLNRVAAELGDEVEPITAALERLVMVANAVRETEASGEQGPDGSSCGEAGDQ